MNKRVLRTIVMGLVCAGLVGIGAAANADSVKPEAAKAAAPAKAAPAKAEAAKAEPAKIDAGKPAAATSAAGKPDPATAESKPAGPPAPPAAPPLAKVETTVLEEPGHYRAEFTNLGAAPQQFVLLKAQFKEDNPRKSNKTAEPIDLIRTLSPFLPAQISFATWKDMPKEVFGFQENVVWKQLPRQGEGDPIVYVYETERARVTKQFTRVPDTYQILLKVTVENLSGQPLDIYPRLSVYGWQDPSKLGGGGFFSFARRNFQTEGLCYVGGKLHKSNFEELQKKGNEGISAQGATGWLGISEHYFGMLVAGEHPSPSDKCELFVNANATDLDRGILKASVTRDKRTVAAHGKNEQSWTLFFGPKILKELDAVRVGAGQEDPNLGRALDYGYGGLAEIFARPMLMILKGVHAVIPSWGIAIIVLTLLVKLITWWPTTRSMKSMREMAKLKPEVEKLKARYGDDKNAFNLAQMELYKKHGVNPLGGCLPVLVQMPIYIGLYAMLGASVELYRSNFLWIKDLTAPDPYYILPILTGGLMLLQQKTQPATGDAQQRTMMYAMSGGFALLNVFWPSGLTIYILTNTILTFVQQLWMKRNEGDKPSKPAAGAKPARA